MFLLSERVTPNVFWALNYIKLVSLYEPIQVTSLIEFEGVYHENKSE